MHTISARTQTLLVALTVFFLTAGLSCSITGNKNQILGSRIDLEMWTVFDSPSDYSAIIQAYRAQYPNINVTVKKFRAENYENELLNALAEDRGPDIFMLHNTELRKYLPKLEPLPREITLPRFMTKGTIKKDVVVSKETLASITPLGVKQKFVDTVADDVIIDGNIYGLPLYLDTLVLYYNRDLLNIAGFARAPQYWDQFQDMSSKITKINLDNNLIQSGAALGTANNIENAPDILALLMMQTGARMTNQQKTTATFHQAIQEGDSKRNPGVEALRFYSDFARKPPTTAYSWNEEQPNNLEAFVNGRLAFFFGYSYHLPLIKTQTLGKLNFSMAPIVQIQGAPPINYANYWLPVVSKKTKHRDAAWSFIQFMASPNNVGKYLTVVKKPTALRELIDDEQNDESLFAFAGQALTAKSWYYGKNPDVMKEAFETMITKALTTEAEMDREAYLQTLLNNAAAVINQTYQ